MNVKLFNSLTNKLEDFNPIEGNIVRIYSCGPTVYNYAHIGNMRAFIFADLLQRVLRTIGEYDVKWVMNITNIDDKTIRDSAYGSLEWKSEMGEQTNDPMENLKSFTLFFESEFKVDIHALGININHFSFIPRATDFIPEMQELIRSIVDNGYGYVADGSVYFDVSAWRKVDVYGKLKKIDFENFRKGVRIDSDQYEREEANDFVLWKAKKEGEPHWEFDVNGISCPGRPGWHIECSAMEKVLLGLPFDIHTGGIDLKFPHHEDEIAQSKAGYGIEPTAFWCHNEFLEVEGEKMSKSKGNFFTLRDLINKGIDPVDIRYLMLSTHYGSKFNFTFDGLRSSNKARIRVQEYIYSLFDVTNGEMTANVDKLRHDVFTNLSNDLHTPKALSELFTFINEHDPKQISNASKSQLIEFFRELNEVFNTWDIAAKSEQISDIPQNIIEIAEKRLQAKKDKNWTDADNLRLEILSLGYLVKDTKDGYQIEKI